MTEKKIDIKGEETIEELAMKVNEVDSMESKMGVCLMIISYLEMKNSVRPGSYTHTIGMSKKYPPKSPKEQEEFNKLVGEDLFSDITTFLFFLKKIDEICYVELVNTYEKISRKEDLNERLMVWGFIVGFVILVIILGSIL
jgi:abortive infection bacteriophage resistance protein